MSAHPAREREAAEARALAQRITSGQLRLTVNDRAQVTEQHGQPIGWATLATAMRTGLVDLAVLGGGEEPG